MHSKMIVKPTNLNAMMAGVGCWTGGKPMISRASTTIANAPVISANTVYNYTTYGISVSGAVLVTGNTVYG